MKYIINYLLLFVIFFLCVTCEKTPAQIAEGEVLECADFSVFAGGDIERELDSNYISGVVSGNQINFKEGFEDYVIRFVDEQRIVVDNPNTPITQSESQYQITFAVGQAAAGGDSFVGAPLFSASIQFPCSVDVNDPVQYINQFEVGQSLPILGRRMDCSEGVTITLRAYCFDIYANGTGYYSATALSSTGGDQLGNTMIIDQVDVNVLQSGQVMIDIEGSFSSHLYFNTNRGSGYFFGTLSDARFSISRILG